MGHRPVVFGRSFALSAQLRSLSLSSSKRRRGPGRGGAFYQFPPLSDPLPARASRGKRAKMPQAFGVPNTTGHRPALLWLRPRRATPYRRVESAARGKEATRRTGPTLCARGLTIVVWSEAEFDLSCVLDRTADSRKGWGQLVPNSFQSGFILNGDGPFPASVRADS